MSGDAEEAYELRTSSTVRRALGETLPEAIATAYANIRKIRSLGSYYRQDIGQSLWPPGSP